MSQMRSTKLGYRLIMKEPQLINAESFKSDVNIRMNGKWVNSRPIAYTNIFTRFKLAFYVFMGKYDALEWYQQ